MEQLDQDYIDDLEEPNPQIEQPKIQHSPNNPPWNSLAAFIVWVFSVVLIIILPGFFLMPYIVSLPTKFTDNAQLVEFAKTDPTAVILQVIAIIPAHILTILLCWLVVTRFRKFSFAETLGWKSGGMKWWHYVAILVSFFAVAGVFGHYYPEQDNDLLRILRSSRTAVFIVAFLATFTAPLVEEVVYRGILYSAFQRTVGVPAAVAIVTILFTVVHVPQYWESASTIAMLALLSLILTLVRVYTNNLLPCIILHTIFNGLQSVLLLLEPTLKRVAETTEPAVFVLSNLN